MVTIERQAVVANVASIAESVGRPFAIVAVPAKRLQGPEPELVPIAFVRRVVVGDGRRREAALPAAKQA